MVVYTLNWCSSTSAVHGWFWLKLLKCMVQFSLVPRFSVGGEKESLVPYGANYRTQLVHISVQERHRNLFLAPNDRGGSRRLE